MASLSISKIRRGEEKKKRSERERERENGMIG